MKKIPQNVVGKFQFEGNFVKAVQISAGHINDTYQLEFEIKGSMNRYILQRINRNVFNNPEGMMSNIQAVTLHLNQKINKAGGDSSRESLTLIPTLDDDFYYRTDDGNYWRGYFFIGNARTYNTIEDLNHAYHAGRAFGNFLFWLSDFPARKLVETIPHFHNTQKRFETFVNVMDKDELNLAQEVKDEIEFVLQRNQVVSVLVNAQNVGVLPERISHNDTKLNNVMFDDLTGAALCVIDLDTVMPGLSLFDYGDAVRSIANSASEDEQDLSLVNIDLEIFETYTRGYLEAVGGVLTSEEKKYLAFSSILMTLECGMRFLTDHLEGDKYFKIHRKGQNLDRCRTQFKLVAEMEKQFDTMERIIKIYC